MFFILFILSGLIQGNLFLSILRGIYRKRNRLYYKLVKEKKYIAEVRNEQTVNLYDKGYNVTIVACVVTRKDPANHTFSRWTSNDSKIRVCDS